VSDQHNAATPSGEPHAFSYAPMPDVGLSVRERLGQYPRVPDITFDALRTVRSEAGDFQQKPPTESVE